MTDSRPVWQHPAPDPAWLALYSEPILEPELPIIDPHHHLWDRGRAYFLDELLADLGAGHRVVSTVFLQCAYGHRTDGPEAMRPVGETEFVAALAAEAERRGVMARVCEGIVGHADLRLGERVTPVLEAHIAAAGGRFRGIRHIIARDESFLVSTMTPPPTQLMADPAFRAGFQQLAPLGLSFDAWLYHPQIDELTGLARAFPGTTIVLNHVGGPLGIGPYRRDEVFAGWRASIDRLAACPNVMCKLGGLAMQVNGFAFNQRPVPPSSAELATAWQPYFDVCIAAFGPARCMFESNFPVDKAMCSYAVLWNAFKRVAAGHSDGDRAALFHDTAARVYRLQSKSD